MIETRNVYVQLMELCQQQLTNGNWAVGERFPSERELATQHGISRATANKVLAKLASEGWLEIRRGAGAFVAERATLFSELRQMDSFTDFGSKFNLQPSTIVICCREERTTSQKFLSELNLKPKAPVLYVERLRRLKGVTVIHEQRWLPARLYPNLNSADLNGSFYALCRDRYGLQVGHENASIQAVKPMMPSELGESPAIQVTGVGFGSKNQPLWRQCLHYRGDCFEFYHSSDGIASFPRLNLRLRSDFIRDFAASTESNSNQ